MTAVRFWLGLWLGKIIGSVLKFLGKKGTTFPGVIAQKICPDIIKRLAVAFVEGTVIITGTNGKTTTNNLLASILQTAGKKVAFNREGANMITGITGTLLQNTSFTGKAKASLLLLEADEATVPYLCRQLTPNLAVITNFFRDQLDRYGELDTTIRLVKEALPPCTGLILNADDPLVAQIGGGRTGVFYYGTERLPVSRKESKESREGRYCSRCGDELTYELFHYGQLGIYQCLKCGFKRPQPYIEAQEVNRKETGISFRVDGDFRVNGDYEIPLQGYYNLYNALAAFCAADRLGVSRENIRQGLISFVSDAGRMEQFSLQSCLLTLTLVKNPTGFNQVINTLAGMGKPLCLLIAINDLAADGRDISWLWDVDFETFITKEVAINLVICSGLRADDMALRLKYAGFNEQQIVVKHELKEAMALLEARQFLSEDAVFVLPTYTALFPLREILTSKNLGKKPSSGQTKAECI